MSTGKISKRYIDAVPLNRVLPIGNNMHMIVKAKSLPENIESSQAFLTVASFFVF